MKRKLIALLCICMLLSGCQTSPPPTEVPTETTVPVASLLDQGTVMEESGNLLYIPNEAVAEMANPELMRMGDSLILWESAGMIVKFKRISLMDGSLMAEASVSTAPATTVFVGQSEIGLCDRMSGKVRILDDSFGLLRSCNVGIKGDDWYLSMGLDTLYILYTDRGLMAVDLETGEERWLVDNGWRVIGKSAENGYLILDYVDRDDQRNRLQCLNLATGELEPVPAGGGVTACARQGDTWLVCGDWDEGAHRLIRDGETLTVAWTGSSPRLLGPCQHLMTTDPSGRGMTIYTTDGTFVSQCALPDSSDAFVCSELVWSDYWNGYFFTDFHDANCRLMFWDVGVETDGEDLQLMAADQPPEPVMEPWIYERARELSQRFGVDIRIGEQCSLEYTNYVTEALTDPQFVCSSLDVLEHSLSQYPDGFFQQMLYGTIESIRIELVSGLWRKEDVDSHPSRANGFAHKSDSYYLIVLDGLGLSDRTVFHEFSHIIDKRLEWDALIREDALFSEEAWLSLQPEGFYYAMSYISVPEELQTYLWNGYFTSDYAMTFPTEDRAVLMALAMRDSGWEFEHGSGLRSKMQFYADCIRDCFDTEGWPETVLWEQFLQ